MQASCSSPSFLHQQTTPNQTKTRQQPAQHLTANIPQWPPRQTRRCSSSPSPSLRTCTRTRPPRRRPWCRVADLRGDPAAALAAPCTEVFSMFGTSAAFLDDRLAPFVAEIDRGRLLGYRGSAYGQLEALMHHGDVVSPEGRALVALIGWDSKDAHLAQRGDGKLIDKHIHYVREDRKSVDMYHVDLTQL
ncbi:hypothetical protein HIM_02504 [Hirsutella minnesotensis 3608]|nr:hypothetical protein HIM_02504 [Hirsutella minnesotensis 3608]